MPDTPPGGDAIPGQILLELGKLSTTVAVMDERLKAMPSLVDRMREVELQLAQDRGGRDTWARVLGGLAVAGAVASGVTNFVHH